MEEHQDGGKQRILATPGHAALPGDGEGYLDEPAFKRVIARDNATFKQLINKLDIKA
ncbi:hypothetical protein [Cupriavidus sp. PET2-C1]